MANSLRPVADPEQDTTPTGLSVMGRARATVDAVAGLSRAALDPAVLAGCAAEPP